jgi:hypothetical protein
MTGLVSKLSSFFHPSSPQKLAKQLASEESITERVRDLMLDMVGQLEQTGRSRRLVHRLRYASDIQGLWFMRGEVVAVLAIAHGEVEALHRVERMSAEVRDSLPGGLRSRPSPLSGNH